VSFLLAYPSCRHSFLLPTSDLFLEVGKVARFEGPHLQKWPISRLLSFVPAWCFWNKVSHVLHCFHPGLGALDLGSWLI
jgi:hypothetical protein